MKKNTIRTALSWIPGQLVIGHWIHVLCVYVSAAEMLSAEKIKKEPADDGIAAQTGKLMDAFMYVWYTLTWE